MFLTDIISFLCKIIQLQLSILTRDWRRSPASVWYQCLTSGSFTIIISSIINLNVTLKIFNGISEFSNPDSPTLFAWLPNLPTHIEASSDGSHGKHDQVCREIDRSRVPTEVTEECGKTSRAEDLQMYIGILFYLLDCTSDTQFKILYLCQISDPNSFVLIQ